MAAFQVKFNWLSRYVTSWALHSHQSVLFSQRSRLNVLEPPPKDQLTFSGVPVLLVQAPRDVRDDGAADQRAKEGSRDVSARVAGPACRWIVGHPLVASNPKSLCGETGRSEEEAETVTRRQETLSRGSAAAVAKWLGVFPTFIELLMTPYVYAIHY